ncbi:MAG: acryloyl-CoA reductase [Chromatiales bacterium]|jgi:acrylyl-CoA reductase (NADPH)
MSQIAFNAYLAQERGQLPRLTQLQIDALMQGDVLVKVDYSGLNYKDALAMTGKGAILRHWPMVPGVDFCGQVQSSDDARFQAGDSVIVTGHGIGESHFGGYAEYARVPADWLLPLPAGLDCRHAMAIGTAGLTAMLAVLALEKHGIDTGRGPVLVTGATGGVGSMAIALLHHAGYTVTAATGRTHEADYLRGLGADEVVHRSEFTAEVKPLATQRWSAAIDVAGGYTLANVLSQLCYGGAAAACGLAESMQLPATVAPFILRGVTLYGIESVQASRAVREQVWQRLATDLDSTLLAQMTEEIDFADLPEAAESMLTGGKRGRLVVRPA